MFHERRQVEVPKDVLRRSFNRLGDPRGLFGVMADLAHLSHEEMVVSRVRDLPIKAREYLGRIPGYKPRNKSRINFHAVFIDELEAAGVSVVCQVPPEGTAMDEGRFEKQRGSGNSLF